MEKGINKQGIARQGMVLGSVMLTLLAGGDLMKGVPVVDGVFTLSVAEARSNCVPSLRRLGTCQSDIARRARIMSRRDSRKKAKATKTECAKLSRQMNIEAPQYRAAVKSCKYEVVRKFGRYDYNLMSESCKKTCSMAYKKSRFFGRMWWACYLNEYAPRPWGIYANPKQLERLGLQKFIKSIK